MLTILPGDEEMNKKIATWESLIAIVTVLLVFNAGASAGDLEPSAPPGPTNI